MTPSAPLPLGTRLGPYEVQGIVGRGGMSVVYRAHDHNLQRAVAIKMMSRAAAEQPGFIERFRQEARLIAALHHPHIVQVYASGEYQGLPYIVEELLPGPTLGQQLRELHARRQPMGRDAILPITRDLANALDAAHAAGVIHRDIKPDNAIYNAQGQIILTDFGIARPLTTNTRYTQTGMVMGTPDYIAPEQAQGQTLTPATDVYALGVVVYEMITGQTPFNDESAINILIQHIQMSPPAMRPLRPDLPASAEGIVLRALAKEPSARYQQASAFADALAQAWLTNAPVGAAVTEPPPVAPPPPVNVHEQPTRAMATGDVPPAARSGAPGTPSIGNSPVPLWGLLLATLALLLVGGAAFFVLAGQPDDSGDNVGGVVPPTPTATSTATATASPTPTAETSPTPEISPTLPPELPTDIPPPPTEQLPPTATTPPLPPPTPAVPPLPPSGTGLAFTSDGGSGFRLFTTSTSTGDVQPLLASTSNDFAPAWSPDGSRVAFHSDRNGNEDIFVLDTRTGEVTQLTSDTANEREPVWSPDGQRLAYWADPNGTWDIYTLVIESRQPTRLTFNFADDFAPAWAPDGSRIAFTSNRDGNDNIYLINPDGGAEEQLTDDPADDKLPAWSPDSIRLLFVSARDGNEDVFVMDRDGSDPQNLTRSQSQDTQPAWSASGAAVVFTSNRNGNPNLYVMGTDGSNVRQLTDLPGNTLDGAWRP